MFDQETNNPVSVDPEKTRIVETSPTENQPPIPNGDSKQNMVMDEKLKKRFPAWVVIALVVSLILLASAAAYVLFTQFRTGNTKDSNNTLSLKENLDFKTYQEALDYAKSKTSFSSPKLVRFIGLFDEKNNVKKWSFTIADPDSIESLTDANSVKYNMRKVREKVITMYNDGEFKSTDTFDTLTGDETIDRLYVDTTNSLEKAVAAAKAVYAERNFSYGYVYRASIWNTHTSNPEWKIAYVRPGEEPKLTAKGNNSLSGLMVSMSPSSLKIIGVSEGTLQTTVY